MHCGRNRGFTRATHLPRYFYDYIYPAVMLLGLSYLALFVDKQSPGRPGIHSVTVLTELTLASAQREQLPPVRIDALPC